LEPGPVVLVTSAWKGNTNIMTMGWHMVLEFSPSLVACCISNANHSFEMIRRSHECVINVPTTDLVNEVIGIGNCSGAEVDKFKAFGLTPAPATNVSAPLIKEYYANFECRLANSSLVSKYDLFIWEVLKAHVASSPKYPETVHYRGQGVFMISGPSISLRKNAETVRKRTEDIALPAESFARAIAFAISQPDEMDVNEILFRPTRQVL
jgi:flavin reductase (DIM6/NTAB) family NADH-FMN oxidoreductase RutF